MIEKQSTRTTMFTAAARDPQKLGKSLMIHRRRHRHSGITSAGRCLYARI